MARYAIHFWDKNVNAQLVDEETAMTILKAKSEGGLFELGGGYYEGSAVWAVVPQKKDLGLFQIEAPRGNPVTKESIAKITKELRDKGLLHSVTPRKQEEIENT